MASPPSPPDLVEQIRRLYYDTSQRTVQRDLQRAIELFKALRSEAERERAAVYMDGLSQMRSEWAAARPAPGKPAAGDRAPGRPARREPRRRS